MLRSLQTTLLLLTLATGTGAVERTVLFELFTNTG